jgi:streptogramin lyase
VAPLRTKRSLLIVALGLVAAFGLYPLREAAAGVPAPLPDQQIVATLVGGEVRLTGQNFGEGSSERAIRFDYEGASTLLDNGSPLVSVWTPSEIVLQLPVEVRPGTLTVIVDGIESAPIDLLVYVYFDVPVPPSPSTNGMPLTLDLAIDGRVWLIEEYHLQLKSFTGDTPSKSSAYTIPQATGGIFASRIGSDARTLISALGEDVDVAPDGSIWLTQGGGSFYDGAFLNTSRIVRFDPTKLTFSCYPLPGDDVEVYGVAIDPARSMVWYAEGDLENGNAIGGFDPATALNNCNWNPYANPRPVYCDGTPTPGCHQRFELPPVRSPAHLVLDGAGDIWFTEFWGNRIARIDPETGTLTELPLPTPIVQAGPGIWAGSGPWELAFDAEGDLWVTEFFDATLLRVRPSLMAESDCTQLDVAGRNPCIEEVFVGSDGLDLRTMHTTYPAASGRVWFGLSAGVDSRVGFASAAHGGTVVFLPPLGVDTSLGGIIEDPTNGDVWFTQYEAQKVGRLRLATGDGDGIDDAVDNCPDTYNPEQENADRDFVDLSQWGLPFHDLTWPASDTIGDACDGDADNDGLPNGEEIGSCPSATGPTDRLDRDTDDDLILDGVECLFGSDPTDASSYPPRSPSGDHDRDGLSDAVELAIGSNPNMSDTDGDRIGDGAEFKSYGSSPVVGNSDGDPCADGSEAASLNGDTRVTSLEMMLVAMSYGGASSPNYKSAFDVNRDTIINSGDLINVALVFGACRAG